MATVLDLAMKVSADASSVPESLTKAEKALLNLGKQADATAALFDTFSKTTDGAGKAAESIRGQFDALAQALKDNAIAPKEYAAAFAAVTQSARDLAAVFEQGAATTAKYRTESERAAIELEKLNKQKQAGAISEETYQRAVDDVTGATKKATEAEAERAATMQRLASEGAAITQKYITDTERRAATLADLKEKVDAGVISEEIYQRAVADASGVLKAAEDSERARQRVMDEGRRITEQYATAEEKREADMARLTALRKENAISEETYQRALADVSGENEKAAAAERERQKVLERAAELTRNVVTPMQQYDQAVAELNTHLQAGTITQETYDANLAKATQQFIKAESAAQGYDQAVESAGKGGMLAFNELSGILAAIPGPIGNIAGRLSGLSSAAEGLGRVFSGGIGAGLSSITASIAGMINPLTLAVAGVAALGAAAAAVATGLSNLSERVENLTNLAARLGTSFGFVQVLEEAARRSGVSIDTLATGMQRFAVHVDEARTGSGNAAKAFEALGISQQELQATDPSDLAGRVAKAIDGIEDPAKRAAIATDLLGKSGLELLPAFASVDDARLAMERFGSAIDDVAQGQLLSLDDAFDNLSLASRSLGQNLLLPFAGLADGIATALGEIIGGISKFVGAVGDLLRPVFTLLGDAIGAVGSAIGQAIGTVGSWIDAFNRMIGVQNQSTQASKEQREAIEQLAQEDLKNFESMTKAIEGTNAELSKAIDEAVQFGQAGFDAALEYQNALKKLDQQLEDGILNETSYTKAVQEVTQAFGDQMDAIKETAAAGAKRAEEEKKAAEKLIADNMKIADSLLEQLRIEEEFGGDSRRAKAAENVLALEEEIARVEKAVLAARNAGDQEAIKANVARLAKLDQVLTKERKIASGIEAENQRLAAEKQKLDDAREKALMDAAKSVNEAELKYSKERFEIEKERIAELNALRMGALDIGDVRTSGGADLFMDFLGKKEDAAIAEYRRQTEEIKGLRADLKKAQAKKAEILKGA